jgi:hypothetical protein
MNQPSKTYVIKKANKTYFIGDKKEFADSIIQLINDIPEIAAKVESKKYTYKNIEELVKEYNRLSTQE